MSVDPKSDGTKPEGTILKVVEAIGMARAYGGVLKWVAGLVLAIGGFMGIRSSIQELKAKPDTAVAEAKAPATSHLPQLPHNTGVATSVPLTAPGTGLPATVSTAAPGAQSLTFVVQSVGPSRPNPFASRRYLNSLGNYQLPGNNSIVLEGPGFASVNLHALVGRTVTATGAMRPGRGGGSTVSITDPSMLKVQ